MLLLHSLFTRLHFRFHSCFHKALSRDATRRHFGNCLSSLVSHSNLFVGSQCCFFVLAWQFRSHSCLLVEAPIIFILNPLVAVGKPFCSSTFTFYFIWWCQPIEVLVPFMFFLILVVCFRFCTYTSITLTTPAIQLNFVFHM